MACLQTHKKWARIKDKQQCQICGIGLPVPHGQLHVHHIVYQCKGGSDELDNLVTLCDLCHMVAHDHMGPSWVGLSEFPIEEQEQMRLILNWAREEFESFLRLPIEERHRIQEELWSQWGVIRNV